MKFTKKVKTLITKYSQYGDISEIVEFSKNENQTEISRVSISNALKKGEGSQRTISLISDFYISRKKRWEAMYGKH